MSNLQPQKQRYLNLSVPPAQILEALRTERAKRAKAAERDRLQRTAEEVRWRCATLSGFVREAWAVLEPTTKLIWNWHLDAICAHLEAVTDGRVTRLLINIPPGSSKSLIVSVLWPAWEWTRPERRALRYLTTAFNDIPVKRDTRKCRDLLLSEWYRALWPDLVLSRAGEMSFANTVTGTREGVPFGSLTSQRGDRLVIDDPHSTKTAESESERETTVRLFREGAVNRLNDQERSAIVVVMQRLHAEDISGVILSRQMGYVHLCLPMCFEVDRRCTTAIGFSDPRTYEGEILDPGRFPPAAVAQLKADMGSYAFAGQYQQRPTPREGGQFKKHWFEVVGASPAGGRRVRAWDLAATEKTSGSDPDWTVGLKLALYPDGTMIIEDVVRLRGDALEVEKAIINTAKQDGFATLIRLPKDPGQAGKVQARYLISKLAGYVVHAVPETGSKTQRASPVEAQAEAGNVKILKAPWNDAFLEEVSMFPGAPHDDQVDALSGAFAALLTPGTLSTSTYSGQ